MIFVSEAFEPSLLLSGTRISDCDHVEMWRRVIDMRPEINKILGLSVPTRGWSDGFRNPFPHTIHSTAIDAISLVA